VAEGSGGVTREVTLVPATPGWEIYGLAVRRVRELAEKTVASGAHSFCARTKLRRGRPAFSKKRKPDEISRPAFLTNC